MKTVSITVNGQTFQRAVEPRMQLADFLRQELGLTGTHQGCEHGVCGACTVLVDGAPVRSCIAYAVSCDGARVETVEGFTGDAVMTRLREAFSEFHALQCGFCTPGMLIAARDIVLSQEAVDEDRIRHALSGNLCRCTGYMGIVAAIAQVIRERAALGVAGGRAAAPGSPRPGFAPFTPADLGEANAPAAAPADSASGRDGYTTLTERFEIAHPADRVWQVLKDLDRVAPCLPGAELTARQGDRFEGRMSIHFGPIGASFAGEGTTHFDDATREGRISGSGIDRKGGARARGEAVFRVVPASASATTRVEISLAFQLAGPLAQFSRSDLVHDFAARLTQTFAGNLEKVLEGRESEIGGLNVVAMTLSVLWARLKRMCGF